MTEQSYLDLVPLPAPSTFTRVQRCLVQCTPDEFNSMRKKPWADYLEMLKQCGVKPGKTEVHPRPGTGKYPWEISSRK